MRVVVVAVGRARDGPERAVYEHYVRRLTAPVALKEVEEKRATPVAERRRREGQRLLAEVPDGATVVALDARGRVLDSEAFAARLAAWRDAGVRDLAFLIGGADGLDAAVTARADLVLSLGPMTWPHLLVRGMLAEQLYRAQAIATGHPYHRA